MGSSSPNPDAPTELVDLPELLESELEDELEGELAEVPTQPIALFELPPSDGKR